MHDLYEPVMPGGITGNGRMLCSIRDNGMLHRLFWPHIDWGQHMGILRAGLQDSGRPVKWTDGEGFEHHQQYDGDTNIFITRSLNPGDGLAVIQKDMVLPEQDVLIRVYSIENTGPAPRALNFIVYCSFNIDESDTLDGMYYHAHHHVLVQFRRGVFLGIKSPGRTPYGFHCGRRNSPSDPFEAASRGEFRGGPDNIKSGAGAMGWHLGTISPGGSAEFTLALAAAGSEGSLVELLGLSILSDSGALAGKVSGYWEGWLAAKERGRPETQLYKRSLLAIKIMSDKTSGASVAAPEFDSHYRASGGYGYCWPRDGFFVALALDEAGYHEEAGMFYRFAARVQNPDGSWHQRYFMNGRWASSWGQQIDQVGAVLWGYGHHYLVTGDRDFLNHIWPSAYSGARYLAASRMAENGLQIPAMDIWEDEFAQSTYASAAVYGGLKGAAVLASAMGDDVSRRSWDEAAESIKESINSHQWNDDMNSFVRSVNRKVCEWDYCQALERGQKALMFPLPGTRDFYRAVPADTRIDISLLGLSFPFVVLSPGDPRMTATAEKIEERLLNRRVGGFHRYEGDGYAGGNPWVLATLWMAVFRSMQGRRDLALEYLRWAEYNSSKAGLLPEQVHRDHGGPAWVLPLNWSHAMYILASRAAMGSLSPALSGVCSKYDFQKK